MAAHTLAQTLTSVHQAIGRCAWWLGLSLVLAVAALVAYRSTPLPNVSAPVVRSAQAVPPNPASQSVFDYLQAYNSNPPLRALATLRDPATQSALDYIHAHERAERPKRGSPWKQATQALLDYLRAHSRSR